MTKIMKKKMWFFFFSFSFHLHFLAVKSEYEKYNHPMLSSRVADFMTKCFSCWPFPHPLNTSKYIFIYIYKMKTWLDQITYILHHSENRLTSWHWLLVKAAASLECGMPLKQIRATSPSLKIPLLLLEENGCWTVYDTALRLKLKGLFETKSMKLWMMLRKQIKNSSNGDWVWRKVMLICLKILAKFKTDTLETI